MNDHLSLWEIAHRWNQIDPDKRYWFGLPLAVKDAFRLMTDAILHAQLVSDLSMSKWKPDSGDSPQFYIRYHLDDIYACIGGHRYKTKFFKFVGVSRWDFHRWCEINAIPLPEFWFPPGWKLNPECYPDDGLEQDDSTTNDAVNSQSESEEKLRTNQSARIACRHIAAKLWKEFPDINIADMVKHEIIQKYGGGNCYIEDTVRDWIRDLAPDHIRGKRGRPSKPDNK